MAEKSTTTTKKKKGKKLGNPAKVGMTLGGALAVYLLYRWYQNNKANSAATTTAGIDPLTGNPYTAGVGSLAPGSSGGSTGTTADPTIDPATGQSWASEIAAATAAGNIDPATGQSYSSELTSAGQAAAAGEQASFQAGQVSGGIDPLTGQTFASELATVEAALGATPPAGSVPPAATTVAPESRTAMIAMVSKATGLSLAQAGQQVALYLEGKPLTSKGAVNSIGNQVKAGLAPTTNGSNTLPTPVLAKAVTQAPAAKAPATNTALATSEKNLAAAQAALKANPGNAAAKAAVSAHQAQIARGA